MKTIYQVDSLDKIWTLDLDSNEITETNLEALVIKDDEIYKRYYPTIEEARYFKNKPFRNGSKMAMVEPKDGKPFFRMIPKFSNYDKHLETTRRLLKLAKEGTIEKVYLQNEETYLTNRITLEEE